MLEALSFFGIPLDRFSGSTNDDIEQLGNDAMAVVLSRTANVLESQKPPPEVVQFVIKHSRTIALGLQHQILLTCSEQLEDKFYGVQKALSVLGVESPEGMDEDGWKA